MKKSLYPYLRLWLSRCLLGLILLSVCRILFIFYLFPYMKGAPLSEVPNVLLGGVLFDVQALVYFLIPFHLISLIPYKEGNKTREMLIKGFFMTGTGLIILLNLIDLEFYKIKTRRSGIELFSLIGDRSNPVMSYILNYWWLLLIFIAFIWIMVKVYPKYRSTLNYGFAKPLLYFVLLSGLLFLGARGSVSIKPLRSFDAVRFVDPQWVSACINSPTQLLTSYNSSAPKVPSYMPDSVAIQICNPYTKLKPYFPEQYKPNVVLIILESFGRDYCGFLNRENRFTPFLDSLSRHSMVYTNAYSSGTTSMESVPAIFASMPSLLEVPYINSNFQNNRVYGIHHYLNRHKYDCSFYYGAANGSMGFDNFLKIAGPIDYIGLNEYKGPESDHDGHWGIWDEPYLQYYAGELSKRPQPFFSSVFTLTSHDPYKIPPVYSKRFKGGKLPIYKAVQYTDNALRLFFNKVKTAPWFNNTVFIITADHPSHSTNEYFYAPSGKYEIPLMVYAPRLIPPGVNDSMTVSHPDIMPTIMQMCGVTEPFFAFGRSLLDTIGNQHKGRMALQSSYGTMQAIAYPYVLRLFPDNRFLMHMQTKSTPNEQIRYRMDVREKAMQTQLENELKARLQLYYRSLINNSWFVPPPEQTKIP